MPAAVYSETRRIISVTLRFNIDIFVVAAADGYKALSL
jgi:hypothetical protein